MKRQTEKIQDKIQRGEKLKISAYDEFLTEKEKQQQFYVASIGYVENQPNVHRPLGIEDYQLLYTKTGKGKCFVNGKLHILNEDSLLFLPPSTPHEYSNAGTEKWTTMYITFNGNGTKGIHKFGPRVLKKVDSRILFTEAFDTINYYKKYPILYKKISLELYSLILDLTELLENTCLGKGIGDAKLAIAMNFLSEDYNNDLMPLLQKINMSKEHFCRIFKKYTGYRPVEYSNLVRIQKAKSLLKSTDLSISDVSSEMGFSNPSYFTSVFKKCVGMTPSEYRNAYINQDK